VIEMMLSAIAQGGQGIDSLELRNVPVPAPGPGQALVRLKAATLNFRDLLVLAGKLPELAQSSSYVPLSCGAGEVTALGDGVSRVAVGDRVSPLFSQVWLSGRTPAPAMLGGTTDGVASQFAVFDAQGLVILPDTLGDMEAASLPCAGLTAWNALHLGRPVQPGDWVLAPGTGGVSIAALQFAKAMGAHVVITSSSERKLARARSMGADVAINYRTCSDVPAGIRSALGGRGVDIIIDVVGVSQLATSAALLNPGGNIAAIGKLGSDISWHGADVSSYPVTRITIGNRDEHEAMLAFCASHAIRPVVDVVYDLARLADALRCLESGAFFGKVGINLL
jgi:NADPH:quinone reductase-like Zn-dependent oxidoreductase